jgi:hypothetical protein
MATTKRIKIEGKPVRPYSLYRIGLNDEIIELVVRADTLEELEAHRRRPDWDLSKSQEDRPALVAADRLKTTSPSNRNLMQSRRRHSF